MNVVDYYYHTCIFIFIGLDDRYKIIRSKLITALGVFNLIISVYPFSMFIKKCMFSNPKNAINLSVAGVIFQNSLKEVSMFVKNYNKAKNVLVNKLKSHLLKHR